MIELRVVGTAEIQTDSVTVTPSQELAFAAVLYLIMQRGRPVSRSRLGSTLWTVETGSVRSHRLRQTLFHLKKLGIPIEANRDQVRIRNANVSIDLDKLIDGGLAPSSWPGTLEFLPGYDPRISPAFAEWVEITREEAHVTLTQALMPLLNTARSSGNWKEVDRICTACLRLDAYNETAVLARAEAFAMRGQKAAAVAFLEAYSAEVNQKNPALAIPANVLRKRIGQHLHQSHSSRFTAHEPDCVGREKEMSVLTGCLVQARNAHGGAYLIEGEPGIGKTRLASELADFAEIQGVRVERATCKRADADQPLSAFLALIPKLRELPGALGASQQSLAWLKRLTDFDPDADAARRGAEDSATVYNNFRSAVFDLLDAVSEEQCLMIVIDDIQWLDRTSASLFGAILEWISERKLFIVFNSRTPNTPIAQYTPPDRLPKIHLKPLQDRDALTIVRGIMGEAESAASAREFDWLIRIAAGNPYFLQELTKHWLETGQEQMMPPSVAAVLDERISRLSITSRQLLQACAVLGENSNLERIEQMLGYAPHRLLAGLQELGTAGMLRSSAPLMGSKQEVFLRHDLLAIEALKALAPASLAFLHRQCGLVLERQAFVTPVSVSLLRACAFHWHQAGDSRRAYDLSMKCATHLLEIGLAADAAASLEIVLTFCSTLEQQLAVLELIVQARRMAREADLLLETIARIRALQDAFGRSDYHDELEIVEFEARRIIASDILPVFSKTLACVFAAHLPASHRVNAAAVALKMATSLPALAEIERVYGEVKPLLRDPSVETRARLQVEVIYNTMCGDFDEAVRFGKERLAFERSNGQSFQLVNALSDLVFVLRRSGPEDEIMSLLCDAYETAKGLRFYAFARDHAERMVAFLLDAGKPGYEPWLAVAQEHHGERSNFHTEFALSADLARIALMEKRFDDAERVIDEDFPWEWLKHRHGMLAAAIALRLRLRIAQGVEAEDFAADLNQLQSLYHVTATLGGQDNEVASLCLGLLVAGDRLGACDLLEDYLSHKRRDRTPCSRELVEVSRVLQTHQSQEESSSQHARKTELAGYASSAEPD